jgi:hypothetical protein
MRTAAIIAAFRLVMLADPVAKLMQQPPAGSKLWERRNFLEALGKHS